MGYGQTPVSTFIRRWLKESKTTQQTLADELKVERSTISQWINGRSMPTEKYLKRIAELAGVEPEYLILLRQAAVLGRQGIEITSKAGAILSNDEHDLVGMWRRGRYADVAKLAIEKMNAISDEPQPSNREIVNKTHNVTLLR